MNYDWNKENPFGSTRFALSEEYRGLRNFDEASVYIGHDTRHDYFASGQAGSVIFAGARGGKLTTLQAQHIMNEFFGLNTVRLDLKAELSMTFPNYINPTYSWNPTGKFSDYLPSHSINPHDHITDQINYVSECIDLAKELVVSRHDGNGNYFTGRAQEILSGVTSGIVEHTGSIHYGVLYDVISSVSVNDEVWPSWAFEFERSQHPHVRKVAAEINQNRFNESSSGGFQGIWGEITKVLQPLADPALYASLTPPFDLSLAEFHASKTRNDLNIIVSPDKIEAMSGILRSIFLNAFKHKLQNPLSRPQFWEIDEASKLKTFPLLFDLFTLGAGLGIKARAIYQSYSQVADNSPTRNPNALLSSAGTTHIFNVRDMETAEYASKRLGVQTLEVDNKIDQSEAANALRQMIASLIARGKNPAPYIMQLRLLQQKTITPQRQHRMLRTPDEVMRQSQFSQFVFTDGVAHAIELMRSPYYENAKYAGMYLPNPYHGSLDVVRVKTRRRYKELPVITEPVPFEFSHLPQFSQTGVWRYVKGYRP